MTTKPPRKVPIRSCIVCRASGDKRNLTRIVRSADNKVFVDLTGKKNGRGAYLCDDPLCWERAIQRHHLDQALKVSVTTEENMAILAHKPVTNTTSRDV